MKPISMRDTQCKFITLSGRKIDLLAPTSQDICIHDICVGMATTNRWAGQTPLDKEPINCATHSLYVLDYIQAAYPDTMLQFPTLALSAILNDAYKAYAGQQPAALGHSLAQKTDVPDQIRTALKKAIFQHFQLPYPVPHDLQKVIEEAENRINATEIRDFNIPVPSEHDPMIYKLGQLPRKEAYDFLLAAITQWLPEDYGLQEAICA